MQRLGRAAAAVLQAHRTLTAGAAVQQQATPALLQLASSGLCGAHHQQAAAHRSCGLQSQQVSHSSSYTLNSSRSSSRARASALLSQAVWPMCNVSGGSLAGHARKVTTSSSSSNSSVVLPASAATHLKAGEGKSQPAKAEIIEGICKRKGIKLGWKKLDFVLRMVRRSYVDDAMAQLMNNPKKSAVYVMHAIANARNNAIVKGGDPAKLWVAEAYVTKGEYQKRIHFMSKGYSSVKESRKSHLNVKVRQLNESDPAAAKMLRQKPRLIAPLTVRMQQGRLGRKKLQLPAQLIA